MLVCIAAVSGPVRALLDSYSSKSLSQWTKSDLEDYLRDNGVMKSRWKEALDSFKNQVSGEKPWYQIWDNDDDRSLLPNWYSKRKGSVSDWLFSDWPDNALKRYLDTNKIKYDANSKKEDLVNAAKGSFNDVSKKLGASGSYPSSSYFTDSWSLEDLQNWLTERGEELDDKARGNKDELIKKVKHTMYRDIYDNSAANSIKDTYYNVLDSLGFANKQIKDTAGEIKSNVFDSWSTEDLRKWLEAHKVKLQKGAEESRDDLLKQAREHTSDLKDDLEWYTETAKQKSSPYLQRGVEEVQNAWRRSSDKVGDFIKGTKDTTENVINDTFMIDYDKWSLDKLKSFLDARGAKYSAKSTQKELAEMAQKYKNKRLKDIPSDLKSQFSGWSMEDVKNWVQDTQIYNKVSGTVQDMNAGANKVGAKANNKMNNIYDSWTDSDLANYLEGFGIRTSAQASRDEMLRAAKENTAAFFGFKAEPTYMKYWHMATNWAAKHISMIMGR